MNEPLVHNEELLVNGLPESSIHTNQQKTKELNQVQKLDNTKCEQTILVI